MLNKFDNVPEYSVSQLSGLIKRKLEDDFQYIRVKGEVSSYKPNKSGHIYFSIKDENALINCIFWKNNVKNINFQLKDGLEVILTGSLSTYKERSNYQINVESVELAGIGALMAKLEELKQKLLKEGLFVAHLKKPLAAYPERIAVITSPTGAVIRDIIHRIKARWPMPIMLWPVAVQGEKCPGEIIAALNGFERLNEDEKPDLIIIARGGGSIEDLWGFNNEELVRRVFSCTIPIISAIGHETDTTLIDYVADLRAPTPTAAAEIATPELNKIRICVKDFSLRADRCINATFMQMQSTLDKKALRIPKPKHIVNNVLQKFDFLCDRLDKALPRYLESKHSQFYKFKEKLESAFAFKNFHNKMHNCLKHYNVQITNKLNNLYLQKLNEFNILDSILDSLSYKKILKRGFALLKDQNNKVIFSSHHIKSGQIYNLVMHDGVTKLMSVGKKNNITEAKQDENQLTLFE